ncbi:DUF2187 family protein [Bacillus toyonensis]|uniref:DUF2187 family protein n=1 Tax=Bacillus toyonensis TaxID=155322 RepID=UPI000BFD6776|nr:DUF2187 family protein [Bacillus toyonensis]PHG57789.1 DUF2187 domain-containing protein [Bacillus toyonensis]
MQSKIGDMFMFEREGLKITGKVIKNYKHSSLFEIITVTGGDFSYDRTVVNHQKYRLCTNDNE